MPHSLLLEPMLARLPRAGSPRDLLDAAVREVMALHGADMGMAQVAAACGDLVMVAQSNIPEGSLAGFARVSPACGTVCGRAAARRAVVYVSEVESDVDFAPFRDFAHSVPFTSVLSAPLVGSAGEVFGVVSVQARQHIAPTDLELAAVSHFTRAVADRLAESGTQSEVAERAAVWADQVQPGGFSCSSVAGSPPGGSCACGKPRCR
jgi:GAF domain-containing protein